MQITVKSLCYIPENQYNILNQLYCNKTNISKKALINLEFCIQQNYPSKVTIKTFTNEN